MNFNLEIFHKFFYSDEDKNEEGRAAVSFYGWTFKSYNTTIGIKTPGKDGRPVLLIADSFFSNTTRRHIQALRSACPYPADHIIPVSFNWCDGWYKKENSINELLQRFINKLSGWKIDNLKRIESRRDFLRIYSNFIRFLELVAPNHPDKATLQKIEEVAIIAKENEDRKKRNALISRLTAKRDAAMKRKLAEEKRKYAELLKQFSDVPYLDKIRIAFFRPEGIGETARADLRHIFNPDGSLSYVIPSPCGSEYVTTTQGINMDYHTVRRALKAWKDGRIRIGQLIGQYPITGLTEEYVTIGCHKIPMQNVRELYSVLVDGTAE